MSPSNPPTAHSHSRSMLSWTMGLVALVSASSLIVGTANASPSRIIIDKKQLPSTSTLPSPFLTINTIPELTTCTGVILQWTYTGPNLPMQLILTNAGVDQTTPAPSSKRSLDKRASFPVRVVLPASPASSTQTVPAQSGEFLYQPVQLPSGWYTAIAQVFLENTSDTQDTFISPRAQPFFVKNGTDTSCVITQAGGTPSVTGVPSTSVPSSTAAGGAGGSSQTTGAAGHSSSETPIPVGSTSSGKNKSAAVAGGVIGTLVVVAICLSAGFYIRNRKVLQAPTKGHTRGRSSGSAGAAGTPGNGKTKRTRRDSRKWGGLDSVDDGQDIPEYGDYNGGGGGGGGGGRGIERKQSSVSVLAVVPTLPSLETKRLQHKSKTTSPSPITFTQPTPVYQYDSYSSGNGNGQESYNMEDIGNTNISARRQQQTRSDSGGFMSPSPNASTDLNHFYPGSTSSTTVLSTSPPPLTTTRSGSKSPPPPPGAWTGGSPGARSVLSTASDPFASEHGHFSTSANASASVLGHSQQIHSIPVAPTGYMRSTSLSTTAAERGDTSSEDVPVAVARSNSNRDSKLKSKRRASASGVESPRDRKAPPPPPSSSTPKARPPPPPIRTSNSNSSSNSNSHQSSYPPSASRSPASPLTMKHSSSSGSAVAVAGDAAATAGGGAATPGHVRGQSFPATSTPSASQTTKKKKTPRKPVPAYDPAEIPDTTSTSPSGGVLGGVSVSSSYGSTASPLAAAMYQESICGVGFGQGTFGHRHQQQHQQQQHKLTKSGSTPNLHASASDVTLAGSTGGGKPGHYTPTSSSRVDLTKMLAEDGGAAQGSGGLTHKGSFTALSAFPGVDPGTLGGGRPLHYLIPDMPPPSRDS